jgi:hypothetical protein
MNRAIAILGARSAIGLDRMTARQHAGWIVCRRSVSGPAEWPFLRVFVLEAT